MKLSYQIIWRCKVMIWKPLKIYLYFLYNGLIWDDGTCNKKSSLIMNSGKPTTVLLWIGCERSLYYKAPLQLLVLLRGHERSQGDRREGGMAQWTHIYTTLSLFQCQLVTWVTSSTVCIHHDSLPNQRPNTKPR